MQNTFEYLQKSCVKTKVFIENFKLNVEILKVFNKDLNDNLLKISKVKDNYYMLFACEKLDNN